MTKSEKYGKKLAEVLFMHKGNEAEVPVKRFRGRDFVGRGLTARVGGVLMNVPGSERDIIIPAFNAFQHIVALKIIDQVGGDFDLCYKLASHLFQRVVEWSTDHPGETPPNRIYVGCVREFKMLNGIFSDSVGAA